MGTTHLTGIILAAVLVSGGFLLLGQGGPVGTAQAGLFVNAVLDLKLNGVDHVSGTVAAGNVLPGDEPARGLINISALGLANKLQQTTGLDPSLVRLDFDVRNNVTETAWPHRNASGRLLSQFLVFRELAYGGDDLLRSPGRNLTQEVDANPLVGNADGVVSLAEMEAGANHLPAPGGPEAPTPFRMGIQLRPETPNDLMGDRDNVIFVFLIRDVANAPLN